MGVCRDCKWWADRDDDGELHVSLPGQYDHTCKNTMVDGSYSIYRPTGVSAREPIGFGPEFGCIHFEAK